MRWLAIDGREYAIRGNWTAEDLKRQYTNFVKKFGNTLTFRQWMVERGKCYLSR